jgi:hypothetical protein
MNYVPKYMYTCIQETTIKEIQVMKYYVHVHINNQCADGKVLIG